MNESNDMTSKQDNEAFEKWFQYSDQVKCTNPQLLTDKVKKQISVIWFAACEYKDAQYRPRYEESEDAIYINGKKFYSEKVVKELEQERAKSQKLVEALEFYMWQNKYNGYQSNRSGEFEYYPAKIIEDGGQTARQAVAEYKKEGGE